VTKTDVYVFRIKLTRDPPTFPVQKGTNPIHISLTFRGHTHDSIPFTDYFGIHFVPVKLLNISQQLAPIRVKSASCAW